MLFYTTKNNINLFRIFTKKKTLCIASDPVDVAQLEPNYWLIEQVMVNLTLFFYFNINQSIMPQARKKEKNWSQIDLNLFDQAIARPKPM